MLFQGGMAICAGIILSDKAGLVKIICNFGIEKQDMGIVKLILVFFLLCRGFIRSRGLAGST